MKSHPKLRRLAFWSFVMAWNLAIVTLGVELLARLVTPHHYMGSLIHKDPELGYVLKQNAKTQYYWRGHFTPIRTNALGLRQDERVELPKPKNEFRILALGDSFTFGWGVNVEDTFVARLRKQLHQAYPDKEISLLNAGHGGYGTQEMIGYLENLGWSYQPDFVVLFMGPQDVADNLRSHLFVVNEQGNVTRNPSPIQHHIINSFPGLSWLSFNSVLYQVLRPAVKQFFSATNPQVKLQASLQFQAPKTKVKVKPRSDKAVKTTKALLLYLNSICKEHDVPLVVASVGMADLQTGAFFATEGSWFKQNKIPLIDVSPFILEKLYADPSKWLIPSDSHYNKEGHRLFTDAFWPQFKKQVHLVLKTKT